MHVILIYLYNMKGILGLLGIAGVMGLEGLTRILALGGNVASRVYDAHRASKALCSQGSNGIMEFTGLMLMLWMQEILHGLGPLPVLVLQSPVCGDLPALASRACHSLPC